MILNALPEKNYSDVVRLFPKIFLSIELENNLEYTLEKNLLMSFDYFEKNFECKT